MQNLFKYNHSLEVEENKEVNNISLKDFLLKLKDIYVFLKSKILIIALAGVIGGVIGVTYAIFKKPKYVATVSFALEDDKSGGFGGALGLASQFGFDLGGSAGGAFSGGNLIELMKSRSMVERSLLCPVTPGDSTTSLADLFLDFREWKKKWPAENGLQTIHFKVDSSRRNYSRQMDSVLGLIYKDITSKSLSVSERDKKISIIDVTLSEENEVFAKVFTETLIKVVSDFYIDTKTRKTSSNVAILQKQTDSVRSELDNDITRMASNNENTFALNSALFVKRTPAQKNQISAQANTAILTELVKNLELAKVTLRKETPLIQLIDRPIYPLRKEKASKAVSLVFGAFLFGFLTVLYLTIRRAAKKYM